MHGVRIGRTFPLALLVVAVLPFGASAQTGSIAGAVVDSTGGVLPGATVEAASPAAIEGVRTTVTDGAGLYEIEALRPGTYTVRFTLAGFSTFIREGIELTSGFTANVDARMSIGSIEETVTVSGVSPVIDVQNVVSQENLSREELDVLPTGKTYWGYAALTVGMNTNIAGGGHDVGGSTGDTWGFVSIHGGRANDGEASWDGMSFNSSIGGGGGIAKQFRINQVAVQEIVVATSNMDAATPFGGVAINAIPKEGGNAFSYYANLSGTNGDLAHDNLNDDLRARGLTAAPNVKKVWDYGAGLGGPIVNDRIWFYTGHRWWGAQNYQPIGNVNLTPHTPFYTPDPDDPAWFDAYNQDNSIRFTVQAAENHKLALTQSFQRGCGCHFFTQYGLADMEGAAIEYVEWPVNLSQVTWTFPASNRLLFEAGGYRLLTINGPRRAEGVVPTDVAHLSFVPFFNWQAFGLFDGISSTYGTQFNVSTYGTRAAVSYVTGTHSFKAGINTQHANENYGLSSHNNPLRFVFLSPGVFPLQVDQFAHPRNAFQSANTVGVYAQDQWTIDRLTLNLGVRYDHINAYVPAQSHPGPLAERYLGEAATRFVPSFNTDPIDNVPNYHDIVPRLGAAYDLLGDGRTALKATFGKYILPVGTAIALSVNPMNAIQTSTSRFWGDAPFQGGNGDFIPDCNFDNFLANGECGPVRNPEFGTPLIVQRYDEDLLEGWGKREYQWQGSVSLQHEVAPGWSVEVGWFRTSYSNWRITDNLNIGPDDFSPFSITAPADPRLGQFDGEELGGLYTITPEGQAKGTDNFITLAKNIPGGDAMSQVFNGVDFTFDGRLDNGISLGGGVSAGSTSFNECFVIDNPTQARPGFCDVSEPWSAGTQVKLHGAVPLPYDTEVSFVFQNLPGLPWESLYQAGAAPDERARIEAQIGRPMVVTSEAIQLFPAGSGRSATFNFIGSQFYEKRLTQLDLRFTKIFDARGARIRGWFDIFNIFNSASATGLVANYTSPSLAYPSLSRVMGGRLFKFGGQFDF